MCVCFVLFFYLFIQNSKGFTYPQQILTFYHCRKTVNLRAEIKYYIVGEALFVLLLQQLNFGSLFFAYCESDFDSVITSIIILVAIMKPWANISRSKQQYSSL